MKEITLKKDEYYFLDGKFFMIQSGKISTREILETGGSVANELYLSAGEIVGNFFKLLKVSGFEVPDIEIEVKAVENNTVLKEFTITEEKLIENESLRQLIMFLLKKSLLKLLYQLYDTKGYVLAVLKLYTNNKKYVKREDIYYGNFNISKSQFYLAYRKLRREGYIKEVNERIYFDKEKVRRYLKLLGEKNF